MKHYLLLPAFFLLFFGLIPSVHACQIMSQPETIDIGQNTLNATSILVGTVSNITYGDEWAVILEVEVEQYLKGEGQSLVEIYVFCATVAELGNRYIFFLHPTADVYLMAHPASSHSYEPTIRATSEAIAVVQSITGQSTPPQALPFTSQFTRWIARYWFWLGGTTIILLTLGYTLFSFKRRPVRKVKMKREELL